MNPRLNVLSTEGQTPEHSREDASDSSDQATEDPRSSLWSRLPDWTITLVIGVAALTIAEVVARNEWVSDLIWPAPSDVWSALVAGIESGVFVRHAMSTLSATMIGFACAAVVAVSLAALLSSIPRLESVLMPFIVAFQTLPKVAVAPLIVLWLGFGQFGKTLITLVVCFFPILINSLQGLRVRDVDQYNLFKSLGATRRQLFWRMRLPNATPYIFAGFHIGVIFALIGAVVAEFVGSRSGLGYIMLQQKSQFNTPGFYAVLLILMTIGLVLHWVMAQLEKRAAFWAEDVSVATP